VEVEDGGSFLPYFLFNFRALRLSSFTFVMSFAFVLLTIRDGMQKVSGADLSYKIF
jgi:hypothetical protein